MGSALQRSVWLRVSLGSLACTIAFMVFFSAVPSAFLAWSDTFPWVQKPELWGFPEMGARIRDILVVAYYGAITPVVFVGFALWQKLHPVNADADEAKRDPGGYR